MKTRLMPIISILILATFVLIAGRGLGAGAKRQVVQPATLQAPAAPAYGITTRVSVASDGSQGNNRSHGGSISADGRYVAFSSNANNLVSGDINSFCYGNFANVSTRDPPPRTIMTPTPPPPESANCEDVFVHDGQTGVTQRVSVASDGNQGNSDSFWPSISANGRYVVFESGASNLVSGDTNGQDIFVHDRQTGSTERVSVASDGSQGNSDSIRPSISADGRYVAFSSYASNLVSGDTNGQDIFVHDRQTGVTQRISLSNDGSQGNSYSDWPSISADGRYVAFESGASNLVSGDTNGSRDVFVHDRQTSSTERISVSSDGSQGNASSDSPSISADGRFVAFSSGANNLVSGDTNGHDDVFVHDWQTGSTQRISMSSDGSQGNSYSGVSSISADGRYVGFESGASNLVSGDTNGYADTFVHDRQTGRTQRVSVASDGTQGNSYSWEPSISADGRYVAFSSYASNLVSGDTNKFCVYTLEAVANIQGFHSIFEHKIGDRSTNLATPPPEPYNCPDVFMHDRGVRNFLFYLPVTQNQP